MSKLAQKKPRVRMKSSGCLPTKRHPRTTNAQEPSTAFGATRRSSRPEPPVLTTDLLVRFRTVLHTPRDHEYLPGLQDDVPIPQLDIQRAVYDEEQLVGVRVGVPDEFAQQLGELDFVVVEGADCALGPVV